ncbi:MAG TPA: TlpA disulfide reductase family protein [Candidatus Polarisedimenticolaceae bacterium]|nr:TlpA disulfide reductase family protein [Candidatus Polarisedimenticolaceae bacterium]
MTSHTGGSTSWNWKLMLGLLTLLATGTTYRIRNLPDDTRAHLTGTNRPAPTFTLQDMEGATRTLEEFRGKAVILNFTATWCGPCDSELPIFRKFVQEHPDDPIALVGVDFDEAAPTVARYAREKGVNYPILIDHGGSVAKAFGVVAFPTTCFIDEEGNVRGFYVGAFEGPVGDMSFRQIVNVQLGQILAASRMSRHLCEPAPDTSPLSVQASWALSRLACACGCGARVLDCDCVEPRGGREIREYYGRLREDKDLSIDNAKQIVLWKYKDKYVW